MRNPLVFPSYSIHVFTESPLLRSTLMSAKLLTCIKTTLFRSNLAWFPFTSLNSTSIGASNSTTRKFPPVVVRRPRKPPGSPTMKDFSDMKKARLRLSLLLD